VVRVFDFHASLLSDGTNDRGSGFVVLFVAVVTVRGRPTSGVRPVSRCVFFGSVRIAVGYGNTWVLSFWFLRNHGNDAGIGRPLLSVRIDELLPDHQLLFPVLQPVFFGKPVIKKVRDVSGPPHPGLVVDLVEPDVEGRPLAEQAGIAAGVFFALEFSGQDLGFLELALFFGQEACGSLRRVELGEFFFLLSFSPFLGGGGVAFAAAAFGVVPAFVTTGGISLAVSVLVVFGISPLRLLWLSRPLSIRLD